MMSSEQREANLPTKAARALPEIYVASRASVQKYPQTWQRFRDAGFPIISTWIDEAGPGETKSMEVLWSLIVEQINRATVLCLYSEFKHLPIKGALVEVGMAMMRGIPIYVCVPGGGATKHEMAKVLGSWVHHSCVVIFDSIERMMQEAAGHDTTGKDQ